MQTTATPAAHTTDTPDQAGPQTPQQPLPAPSADHSAQQPAAGVLAEAASMRQVQFFRLRANGSTRALPYLPLGSTAREVADYAAHQVSEGQSVRAVAEDMGLSTASVRRLLASVELAEAVEDDDLDDLYEDGVDAIYLVVAGDEADES